ncbi:MAG TPA: redoxin family protein [Nitrososphaerales archaeon]|nr:redoxin family protein [Nitrososphaerales archaeon]
MKANAYVIVFGIIAIVVVAAAVSTLFTSQGSGQAVGNPSDLPYYGAAQDFQGIAAWINSPALHISQLHGKVVLVDFWTYSCINCIRTIPYLNAWYNEYRNNGLVVVGVHTPEFAFEKNYSNVLAAVNSFGIKYPVALDSNYDTWNAYGNEYWPADYVIDSNGTIRYEQLGEGDYNGTESVIRELLQSAHYNVPSAAVYSTISSTSVDFSQIGTPELYVGYATARQPIGNAQGFSPEKIVSYTIEGGLQRNYAYFTGDWYNANDSMIASGENAKVYLIYDARLVNIVAQGNNTLVAVSLDGNTPSQSFLGKDLSLAGGSASARIGMARLYNIVNGPSYGEHEVVITASPGFRLYTFTFG